MRRFAGNGAVVTGLVTAAVTAALVLTGPLHMVLEHHVWCAEHGGIVPAHGAHAAGHGDDARGHPAGGHTSHDHAAHDHAAHDHDGSPAPEGPGRPGLPHSHDGETCVWALLLRAPGAPAVSAAPCVAPAGFVVAPVAAAPALAVPPIAVLALAPSHSPPAPAAS